MVGDIICWTSIATVLITVQDLTQLILYAVFIAYLLLVYASATGFWAISYALGCHDLGTFGIVMGAVGRRLERSGGHQGADKGRVRESQSSTEFGERAGGDRSASLELPPPYYLVRTIFFGDGPS